MPGGAVTDPSIGVNGEGWESWRNWAWRSATVCWMPCIWRASSSRCVTDVLPAVGNREVEDSNGEVGGDEPSGRVESEEGCVCVWESIVLPGAAELFREITFDGGVDKGLCSCVRMKGVIANVFSAAPWVARRA